VYSEGDEDARDGGVDGACISAEEGSWSAIGLMGEMAISRFHRTCVGGPRQRAAGEGHGQPQTRSDLVVERAYTLSPHSVRVIPCRTSYYNTTWLINRLGGFGGVDQRAREGYNHSNALKTCC